MLEQGSSVEHFHKQGHGAAYRALAGFVAADCAQIVNAQTNGKFGLRQLFPVRAGSHTDSFEGGGGHYLGQLLGKSVNVRRLARNFTAGVHHRSEAVAAMSAAVFGGNRAKLLRRDGHGGHVLIGHARVTNKRPIGATPANGASSCSVFALAKVNLVGHFSNSCLAGQCPSADDQEIGPKVRPVKHNRTRFVAK